METNTTEEHGPDEHIYDGHASTSVPDEMEKFAEALEARNFKLAGVCLRKIADGIVPPSSSPGQETQEALSSSFNAEMHKACKALESKEFHLAEMCLRKAMKAAAEVPLPEGWELLNPKEAQHCAHQMATTLGSGDFSGAAIFTRKIATCFSFPGGSTVGLPEAKPDNY